MAHPLAILFDKDGTLIDYHKSWSAVNRAAAALAARGDSAMAERLLEIGGFDLGQGRTKPDTLLAAGSAADIARAWHSEGSPIAVDELERALDDLFQDVVATAVPVTDLAGLFTRLKARGYRLGIASSDSERAIRGTVERFRLESLVDFVAGYDSGFGSKPEAGMLLAFCRAVSVRPEEAVMVGDNTHDMAMALAGGAGLKVGVLTGTGTRASLEACCDVCIDSIALLEELLTARNGDGN